MSEIEFLAAEKRILVEKVQAYFSRSLDQEIGQFDAEFLLDFFAKEIGAYFYNQGLADARTVIANQVDLITDALYEIEKPTDFLKG